MSVEDRLDKIEEQLSQLMSLIGRGIKLRDIVVATSTQYIKENIYAWCAIVEHPDYKRLVQTGFTQADNCIDMPHKAELMSAWAGLQTALHLPNQTDGIHLISDTPLTDHLKHGYIVAWTNEDLQDRYEQLQNIYPTNKISNEPITQSQKDKYLEECYKVLRELRERVEKEQEKCSQSAESESSPETNK